MNEANDRVDLNHAPREILAELPGIGGALAGRIVAYREAVEPFRTVDDLLNVPGISDRKLASLRDHILVTPADPAASPPLVRWDDLGLPDADSAAEPAIADEDLAPASEEEAASGDGDDDPVAAASGETPQEASDGDPLLDGIDEPLAPQELIEAISLPTEEPPAAEEQPAPAAPFTPPEESGRRPFLVTGAEEAQRMGCMPLLGGLVGGVLAIVVTLGLLAFFNGGTLRFAPAARINALQAEQTQLEEKLVDLQSALATTTANGRGNERDLATLAAAAADTAATAEALATDIAEIDMAAADFNGLIAGLRGLLDGLPSGPTPTPTATRATATPTPAGADATPSPPPPTETAPGATRTPRPTATPFQTATPVQTATP